MVVNRAVELACLAKKPIVVFRSLSMLGLVGRDCTWQGVVERAEKRGTGDVMRVGERR